MKRALDGKTPPASRFPLLTLGPAANGEFKVGSASCSWHGRRSPGTPCCRAKQASSAAGVATASAERCPRVTRSAYRLPYGGIVLAEGWVDPLSSDAQEEEVAGIVVLRGSRRLAYAAAPCRTSRARLAVREPRDREMQSRTMRTRLHLKPGQKGTKQLLAQYGDRLVCVRYRYDAQRNKRFKTVELIVAERDWDPPAPRLADDTRVAVRVDFAEVELRQRMKQAGGTWNPDRRVWELRYADVVALKLEARIAEERASYTGCLR